MDLLETRFRAANLACTVTAEPIEGSRRGDRVEVVQIDIARVRRGEEFRVYRGASSNRVEVTTLDRDERQLVLLVWEPRRRFTATISKLAPRPRASRVVWEDKHFWVVEQHTESRRRHFLCGMDESHLFIAQLPRPAPTVAEAHRILRPDELSPRVKRQGEWFFVEPFPADVGEIERAGFVRRSVGIAQAAGLARAGRPHVADEVCVLGERAFVRGAVRHPDHRTVRFRHWMRAVPNTEAFDQPAGVRWID
jgi:hypothetical protein